MKSKSKLWLKAISALTAGTLMMSMTACSGLTEKAEEFIEEAAVPGSITAYAEGTGAPVIDKKYIGWVSEYGNLRLDMPEKHLDPELVYNSVEYTDEYFFGKYDVKEFYKDGEFQNEGETCKNFFSSHKKFDVDSYYEQINYLPVSMSNSDSGAYWYFCSKYDEGYTFSISGEIKVENNQLIFTPKESNKMEPIAYDFSFRGPTLTLTYDGESVELTSRSFIEGQKYYFDDIYVSKKARSDMLDGIQEVYIGNDWCHFYTPDGQRIRNVAAYFGEDGRFNASWTEDDGKIHAYELVYFLTGKGLILTDGTNTYFYTE